MVVNKRKKVVKYRGHVTHGGGSRKKRRGAGSRGGRGNAGTGKRAGHRKAGMSRKLGARGFTSIHTSGKVVNIGHFTLKWLEKLVLKGKARKEGEAYVVDLSTLKFSKLLALGKAEAVLHLTVNQASQKAVDKVESAGGKVITKSLKG